MNMATTRKPEPRGARTREREPRVACVPAASRCRSCSHALESPGEYGWECECGIVVCMDRDCFEQYFKPVAGGEATRCLTCGLLT